MHSPMPFSLAIQFPLITPYASAGIIPTVPLLRHLCRYESGDGVGHRGRIVDRDPRSGARDGDQRGVGEVGGEPPGVLQWEEAAFLAPDQQDRPVEVRDLPEIGR